MGTQGQITTGENGFWTAYGRNVLAVQFASTTENAIPSTAPYVNDTYGADVGAYYDMLTAFCATTYSFADWFTNMQSKTFFALRPISDLSRLQQAKSARLIEARFGAFDFSGAADPYPGVRVGNWMPNFFRPQIRINEQPAITQANIGTGFASVQSPGDLSMGYNLPFCLEGDFQVVNEGQQQVRIEVKAGCGRILSDDVVQPYAMMAMLYFVIQENQ